MIIDSLDTNLALAPDASSSDLHLSHPTAGECQIVWTYSSQAWIDALSLPQYLEESAYLTTVPLARNGAMTNWILTDKTLPPDHRPVLCSCETFRKRAFISDGNGRPTEKIIHGVASVFCNPDLRRRGFGSRLMKELATILRDFQAETMEPIGSVLYSDIGKKYYADLGWHPFPINAHIELDPSTAPEGPGITRLRSSDLERLCQEDEVMIKKEMSSPSSNGKTRMMLVPDLDHMLWHHKKEEFVCKKLFGKQPHTKGALVGQAGNRIWAIWTHRFYGAPHDASSENTLYILRLVIENQANKGTSQDSQFERQVEQMRDILLAAKDEAAEWKLHRVMMWGPTPLVSELIKRTEVQCRIVERDHEGIGSLLWYGEGSGKEDVVRTEKASTYTPMRKTTSTTVAGEAAYCHGTTSPESIWVTRALETICFSPKISMYYVKSEPTSSSYTPSFDPPHPTFPTFPAAEIKAPCIAAIYEAAFGTNAILLAQFPTSTVRQNLQTCIATKALADIQDSNIAVLVMREDGQCDEADKIIAFAKWSLPIEQGKPYEEVPWRWPEGTDFEVLERWRQKVDGAKERVMGDGFWYRELPDIKPKLFSTA
ncbi:MAG: hypothetical protein Q9170_001490 [Blastenia crenularia]